MTELLPARAPALRQAATRGFEATASAAGPNYIRSTDVVVTTDGGSVWTAGWGFWTTSSNSEVYRSGNTSLVAAIEYPVGSGSWTYANECPAGASITFDLGGSSKLALFTFNKVLPRRKAVRVRLFQDSAAFVFWRQGQRVDQAWANVQGMDGPSNGTRPGFLDAFTNYSEYSFPPILFATQTREPSVLLFHDSREECESDGPRPPTYDNGLCTPAIATRCGYTQVGHSGFGLNQFLTAANKTQRLALAPYFTHVGNLFGINDINAFARTAPQLLADDATFAALFPNNECFTCTLAPATSSTDGYATLANQSIGTLITKIRSVNEGRRAGVVGYSFCLDVADKIDPFATGKWPIDRNPALASRATACTFTGSISGSTLTVTAISSGSLNVNDPIIDNLTGSPTIQVTGVVIQEQLTGSAGSTGTYRISRPQTLSSRTLYVGGYGCVDSLHQTKDLSEQVKTKLIPDVAVLFK